MDIADSLTNISVFFSHIPDNFYENGVSFIKFLASVFCYFFLKRSAEYDAFFLFRGYFITFKIFAEFISAAVIVTYGIVEMDLFYLAGGIFAITMSYVVRIVLQYYQENSPEKGLSCATVLLSTFYVLTVYACSTAFLHIVIVTGAIPCITKVIIHVLPMMALSRSLKHITSDSFFIANIADFIALANFWWYCSETCIRYFVVVPNILAVIVVLIESFSSQISEVFEDHTDEELLNYEVIPSNENTVQDYVSTFADLEEVGNAPVIKVLKMNQPYKLIIS